MLKRCVMVVALILVLAPASARADWLFTPHVGGTFGGSTPTNDFTWGASIGWMGAGVFGFDAEFALTPEFFESGDGDFDVFDTSNVTTFMFNAILGTPVGGTTGGGFRPYISAGAGLMQTNVTDAESLFEINNSEFGVNVGGGAMGFMTDHVGFRGDIRYYRALADPDEDNEFDIGFGDLDFWRGTVGVTFRW